MIEITNLKSEIKKVKVTNTLGTSKNKRLYQRVRLENCSSALENVDFGILSLKRLNNKIIEGEILNISIGGIGFLCEVDFPITNMLLVNFRAIKEKNKLEIKCLLFMYEGIFFLNNLVTKKNLSPEH